MFASAAGSLVPVMTRYAPPPAGIYVIRPPGRLPARKIRVVTDMLVECFHEPHPSPAPPFHTEPSDAVG
jgi:DNA-binding transcriptional LysR family regulator